jgi:hypothetical protein
MLVPFMNPKSCLIIIFLESIEKFPFPPYELLNRAIKYQRLCSRVIHEW